MLRTECLKRATDHGEAVETERRHDAVRTRYVNGIFEASVTTNLSLILARQSFGVFSTAKAWENALTRAVHEYRGTGGEFSCSRYVGYETTGLIATELHDLPPERVGRAMKDATGRLLRRGDRPEGPIQAICLGCAGMTGLDDTVREACIEALGEERGKLVHIVDAVKAGVTSFVGISVARS